MTSAATPQDSTLRILVSKVPEVAAFFWMIKVLATTVGETAADYLNTNLKLGLTGTSLIMGALLIAVLIVQFRLKKYVPGVYWFAIVLISVVGTLITDNLIDNFGVSLWTSSAMFSAALAATFTAWYLRERTLSIHSIFTARREGFYWLAVLFTFALGTATGDLLAEKLQLGYLNSVLLFAGVITVAALAHIYLKLGSILTFWMVYVLTRPLGASTRDFLSQARMDGGLGLGTTVTSLIFLAAILGVVSYLAITRRNQVALSGVEVNAA